MMLFYHRKKTQTIKIMKLSKIILFGFLLVLIPSIKSTAQSKLPTELINSIKNGNSENLAIFFRDRIELSIQEKEATYSKTQATQIMTKFFSDFPPVRFSIKHKGGKTGSEYIIGNLETRKQNFRIVFFMKTINGKFFIHKFDIETD